MNIMLRQINCTLKRLIRGNEKIMLDMTFLKMLINPEQIGPAEDNPTTA